VRREIREYLAELELEVGHEYSASDLTLQAKNLQKLWHEDSSFIAPRERKRERSARINQARDYLLDHLDVVKEMVRQQSADVPVRPEEAAATSESATREAVEACSNRTGRELLLSLKEGGHLIDEELLWSGFSRLVADGTLQPMGHRARIRLRKSFGRCTGYDVVENGENLWRALVKFGIDDSPSGGCNSGPNHVAFNLKGDAWLMSGADYALCFCDRKSNSELLVMIRDSKSLGFERVPYPVPTTRLNGATSLVSTVSSFDRAMAIRAILERSVSDSNANR